MYLNEKNLIYFKELAVVAKLVILSLTPRYSEIDFKGVLLKLFNIFYDKINIDHSCLIYSVSVKFSKCEVFFSLCMKSQLLRQRLWKRIPGIR